MKQKCIISGQTIQHTDRNVKVEPFIVRELLYVASVDEESRQLLCKALLNNQETITKVAEVLLSVKCEEVGLSVPGTLAEFFLRNGCKNSK